jgi:adenine-specific DNA-methyltransferase
MTQHDDDFTLASQEALSPAEPAAKKPSKSTKKTTVQAKTVATPDIISYRHLEKRKNNPEVGMVTPDTDPDAPQTQWAYDPHLAPELQFDSQRAALETLIDDALASGDQDTMRAALEQLKRQSQPFLNWSGKAERTSFEIDTVSLHIHERIDPATILAAVSKIIKGKKGEFAGQMGLFSAPFEQLPLRDALDFYKHEKGWSNRLVAGDSLLVMNSLLQKEGMAGRLQMIYIDPPYGIKYGSNFQPFVNKRDVKDRRDEDLTQEPEMIKAFRDTWELGIHSYLTYLRDRLLLARELLTESGSVFVQISDENLHHVRELMDEVFGEDNFCSVITVSKTAGQASELLANVADYIVWYAKNKKIVKFNQPFKEKVIGSDGSSHYGYMQLPSGQRRGLKSNEKNSQLHNDVRMYAPTSLVSQGGTGEGSEPFVFNGRSFTISDRDHWKTNYLGRERLKKAQRIHVAANSLRFVRFIDDFPATPYTNIWDDTATGNFTDTKIYVVQTGVKILERCMQMTTDAGDLVFDPTCGSGTTAYVAEKWGRRWITCDTSRVAITLAKQRLMTASYDYFELKYPQEGVKGGFIYQTVPHVTLKSIANNPDIDTIYEQMHPAIEQALAALNETLTPTPLPKGEGLKEWDVPFDMPLDWPATAKTVFEAFHAARQAMQRKMDASIASHADSEILYDKPQITRNKLRITGPFSVEAVPFPCVLSLDEAQQHPEADVTIARSGESARQHTWRDELLKTGIRGKGGQQLKFADLETLPDSRYLHCVGTLETGEKVVVSFGPEHAALEQRQVEMAIRDAGHLFPLPKMIVFCAFTFDPEAAKDIDAFKGITALKAHMNTDLLTEDLKKGRKSNQSFWLMGQPDVDVKKLKDGKYQVEVNGFDYFDTAKGELVSGGKGNIAMWSLDTDYNERSLFPQQIFFPMAGAKDGWHKLKKDIRAELDESKLAQFHGTVSLPFEAGDNRKIAVKIVDDRGIESLKVITLD